MCIIIDANQAGELAKGEKPYIREVLHWIKSGGAIVSGGALERELFKHSHMRDLLGQLSRSGQLRIIQHAQIEATQTRVQPHCASNDAHVVALAIEARTRVIVTRDALLIQDLKNTAIVGNRRRIIKENSANPNRISHVEHLLKSANCN